LRDRPRTQIALFDATRLAAAFELGRRYHAARARRGALLTDAARVARYFGPRLASLVYEELWIAALETHGRIRETRLLARGSDDAAQPAARRGLVRRIRA
jgi:DNA repair protein RadC